MPHLKLCPVGGENRNHVAGCPLTVLGSVCPFIEKKGFQFLGKLDFALCQITGLVEPPSVPKTV